MLEEGQGEGGGRKKGLGLSQSCVSVELFLRKERGRKKGAGERR